MDWKTSTKCRYLQESGVITWTFQFSYITCIILFIFIYIIFWPVLYSVNPKTIVNSLSQNLTKYILYSSLLEVFPTSVNDIESREQILTILKLHPVPRTTYLNVVNCFYHKKRGTVASQTFTFLSRLEYSAIKNIFNKCTRNPIPIK